LGKSQNFFVAVLNLQVHLCKVLGDSSFQLDHFALKQIADTLSALVNSSATCFILFLDIVHFSCEVPPHLIVFGFQLVMQLKLQLFNFSVCLLQLQIQMRFSLLRMLLLPSQPIIKTFLHLCCCSFKQLPHFQQLFIDDIIYIILIL
jgi:hypothetical protein